MFRKKSLEDDIPRIGTFKDGNLIFACAESPPDLLKYRLAHPDHDVAGLTWVGGKKSEICMLLEEGE